MAAVDRVVSGVGTLRMPAKLPTVGLTFLVPPKENDMNRRIAIALTTGALLLGGTASFADDPNDNKPPMHMHKTEMDHRSDHDVAAEYKSEAAQLREKAESHRKLAKLYHGRTPIKGGANYENVAKHCESLAKYYEDAAKEAEGVASELNK